MYRFRACAFILVALIGLRAGGAPPANKTQGHTQKQNPPIQLGTSGGSIMDYSAMYCCSGTLGALVSKGGGTYILSNNHVLARTGLAAPDEDISQPGLVDVGCQLTSKNSNIVADFSEAIVLGTKNVDAALAMIRAGKVDTAGRILDIGIPASTPTDPGVGMAVAKSGRTTGLTCASIKSILTDVNVQYQRGCGVGDKFIIGYQDQVLIQDRSFSAGGDSGSLIVSSDTAQPVALLFAGSSTTTIGNPVSDVINAFGGPTGFSFVGGTTHPVTCPSPGKPGKTTPPASDIERARNVKERHARALMADPAVQGLGVGIADDNDSEVVLVIYVETGRAHLPIPTHLDGVRTEIIRTDRFVAYGWNEPTGAGACTVK